MDEKYCDGRVYWALEDHTDWVPLSPIALIHAIAEWQRPLLAMIGARILIFDAVRDKCSVKLLYLTFFFTATESGKFWMSIKLSVAICEQFLTNSYWEFLADWFPQDW